MITVGLNRIALDKVDVEDLSLIRIPGDFLSSKNIGNIVYPGLIAAWSDEGKTNEDKDRDVLRDLTGNGHDIQLYNVAFSGMSGHGGYIMNLKEQLGNNQIYDYKQAYPTYTIFSKIGNFTRFNKGNSFYGRKIRFKVLGINDNNHFISIQWFHFLTTNLQNKEEIYYGDFELDIPNQEDYDSNVDKNPYISIDVKGTDKPINITIELLPEYPGALVLDGVNDYGICENMPITTDYTIIAKRILFSDNNSAPFLSKLKSTRSGAFYIEGDLTHDNIMSFGLSNKVIYNNSKITFITKNSYNGQLINNGSNKDSDSIFLGRIRKDYGGTWKGAFYSAYLFDRSLDEQEIKSFIRKYIDPEYLLPSESEYMYLDEGQLDVSKLQ